MPEFRFWGRHDPRGRQKMPLLAELPGVSTGEDGVTVLRLYEPIDSWGEDWGTSAREFLAVLDRIDTPAIELHINSPGGEVYEAIAILNALRAHPARVTSVVDGLAASAASFIAAGSDELVMGRNTELMIHDAWGIGIGPAATMRDLADRLDHISDNIASIYAAKASGTVEDFRAAMLDETWYSAEDAVSAGLADRVADDSGEAGGAAQDRFDLSGFRGRADQGTARAVRYAARRHRAAAARHHLATL